MRWSLSLLLLACSEPTDDKASDALLDSAPAPEARCDEEAGRAILPGPFSCSTAPETIQIGGVEIFKYEASHPLATESSAFPCAQSRGDIIEAPLEETEPCSQPGVRPWHSVNYAEAQAACEAIGWRLCSAEELERACRGSQDSAYTWGDSFRAEACNLRNLYKDPESDEGFTSESPTGYYSECISAEGLYDLSGNLWEWVFKEDEHLRRQGAGWMLIPQQHHDENLICAAQLSLPTLIQDYASPDTGFRCCRAAP